MLVGDRRSSEALFTAVGGSMESMADFVVEIYSFYSINLLCYLLINKLSQ